MQFLYNYVYANVKFLCIYQLLNISTCSEERGHVTKWQLKWPGNLYSPILFSSFIDWQKVHRKYYTSFACKNKQTKTNRNLLNTLIKRSVGYLKLFISWWKCVWLESYSSTSTLYLGNKVCWHITWSMETEIWKWKYGSEKKATWWCLMPCWLMIVSHTQGLLSPSKLWELGTRTSDFSKHYTVI